MAFWTVGLSRDYVIPNNFFWMHVVVVAQFLPLPSSDCFSNTSWKFATTPRLTNNEVCCFHRMSVCCNGAFYNLIGLQYSCSRQYRYCHARSFDKMQIIFKAITGSSGHAFWGGEELYCTLWRRRFDAGLVAFQESISPRKGIYYGTLRCRTLPSKEELPKAATSSVVLATDFPLARTVPHFLSPEGVTGTSGIASNIICI